MTDDPGRDARLPSEKPAHGTRVALHGVLGEAIAASHAGRLSCFVEDERSPAIALFEPSRAGANHEGDWYGEHAGKWLWAASHAARRTGDERLAAAVRRVADYLVSVQEPDGYLGTYAPARRFMTPQPPGPRTWDGAPSLRTWDAWVHSYLVLGLLAADAFDADHRYRAAAQKIGDLCSRTLTEGGVDVTHLGNHFGLSATVLIDAAVELYEATGERRYLELARVVVAQADARPELALVSRALAGIDVAEIATGKAYQLLWNAVGLAKLAAATGERDYLRAARNIWESVRRYHLTLGGGPWGGVALRSREVFNHPGVFSPHAYVETCSTLAWLQLNRVLLAATGEPAFADEIERAAYNDLLGAAAPDGENWCYYSFPNGKRVYTTYWRCCKSSGAMALEELAANAYTAGGDVVVVNLYGPSRADVSLATAGQVLFEQDTNYPFDGAIRIAVTPARPAIFVVRLRVPAWAAGARVSVRASVEGADRHDGAGRDAVGAQYGAPREAAAGAYFEIVREWREGDEILVDFPMSPVVHRASSRNVQESIAPGGVPVVQEVMRRDYVALTRGPLVYATALLDGFKTEETLRLPVDERDAVRECGRTAEGHPVALELCPLGRDPIVFRPYYEAGGRADGAWRLTWMQVAESALGEGERGPCSA